MDLLQKRPPLILGYGGTRFGILSFVRETIHTGASLTTIKDVAARAGVSISTVSRALNSTGSVNPLLAERIKRAAAELRYVPNPLGRNLRKQRQAIWTLIVADIENPFQTAVAKGVEDAARSGGYSLLLGNSDEDPVKEAGYLLLAAQSRVTGVLLTPASPDTNVDAVREQGIPIVAIDRPLSESAETDAVLVDTTAAVLKGIRALATAGRQRIGCITGPRQIYTSEQRVHNYRSGLQSVRQPVDEDLIQYADFRVAGGRQAAEELLHKKVDALVVASNQMTIGALQAIQDKGLVVGKDIDVVVFDDAPWVNLFEGLITLISQPAYELGHAAGRLLLDRIQHGNRSPQVVTLQASIRYPAAPNSLPLAGHRAPWI